jgi:hypothetical protein
MFDYKHDIELLVNFQRELLDAFIFHYPNASEFEYLTNFPKSGVLQIGESTWKFKKHGLGVGFIRESPNPNIVVEMNINFGDITYIDRWRLMLFSESLGHKIDEKQLTEDIANYKKLQDSH